MTLWIVDTANDIEAQFEIIESIEIVNERDIKEYASHSSNKPGIIIRDPRPYKIDMTVAITSNFENIKRKLSYLQMSGLDLLLVVGDLQEAILGGIANIDRTDDALSATLQRNDISFVGNSVILGHAREAEDISTSGGTTVTDSNASDGEAVELNANGELVYFEMTQSKWELPTGDYTLYARAKDTNNISNDFKMDVVNQTDSTSVASSLNTVTNSYGWYSLDFTLDSADNNDTIQFKITKATSNANTITVDLLAVVGS